MKDSYSKEEVMYIMEVIGSMYEYDYASGLWNMQTNMAPGLIHEGTESLLNRMEYGLAFSVNYYAEQRKIKPLKR
mgnify:CR=1 FL=1